MYEVNTSITAQSPAQPSVLHDTQYDQGECELHGERAGSKCYDEVNLTVLPLACLLRDVKGGSSCCRTELRPPCAVCLH